MLDRATGARTGTTFAQLPRFLRPGDLLVLNETRVLRARLFTRLERTGRPVEVLLAHPHEPAGATWTAMLGPGRRLRPGDRLLPEGWTPPAAAGATAAGGPVLVLVAPEGGGLWSLRVEGAPLEALLERCGHVPLPPYLERGDTPEDRSWYQTVFARRDGAVAAPTAGLHFTPELLGRLEAGGVALARIVLHVGPGTFLPVRAERREEHRVLPERYEVPPEAAEAIGRARRTGGRVVAVGTTVVRALETAARDAGGAAAGDAGGSGAEDGRGAAVAAGAGWTDLTILPGHGFRAVDALVTNFHLPRSSLLLLVAAFAGRERVLEAYAEARDAGFRFYSYGDAMLIA